MEKITNNQIISVGFRVAALKMTTKIRGKVIHCQEDTVAYLGNRVG